ncbi:MAG: Glycosyl transferase, group 1 [Candidatus Amesbacteria bacterium GW2011_GWA2_47_11b]|uniref:Glycosyl transferase, group 1 n=3 Tax=Candidatus Amesiibacteriota TaxID=1752730 RepID=A0A0G1SLQ7_9BACT|nr:MAG: Glycosyl transferase, group 1 [Candidatus Curtissbacteria bacterium GW2011_GWB1_40_28]KKU29420.1 MAG: Glycosyl transferase, group 1 [Microgenomates group bacterium GW2011_GWC1_46_20]KKU58522.1 MAG: Glycosyl transferase, group 1 [Candidatus Amesbacteria bacterium GW2011_GWA2_47_11b]KKU70361.1 MAG: Glycosyl transferase, group 1 [Candidatus Amesbacteria bacterium GW2011_GWA1_47_20]KKU83649.1 MAG: Glycosyl transferase, group 1 [Candidatus Amesbacteria bacterium GW2011_GWC2_47_8]
MKLLFYSPVDLCAGLGCERWHCDVTNSLKNKFGHQIKIITGNLGYKRWSETYLLSQLQSIPHERLNYPIVISSLIPTPGIFFKLLTEFRLADTVHFIHGFIGQDILMAILKILTRKRVVVGHHAPMFHFSAIHNLYMRCVSRYVLKIFDAHMALNCQDAKALLNWGIKNIHFIPSGVRVERFLSLPRKTHSHLNFLSVGRYDTPQKGFDLLLEAIAKFNQKYPHNKAVFRFAGSGGSRNPINNYAQKADNIIDLGFVMYEDMPKIYSFSDIFLLSSREEPFGLILVEAWSSGIPVLATKTEGPKDMLLPGKNGWFFDEISVSGILTGIEKIYRLWIADRSKIIQLEKNCRDTGKIYSIDITAYKMDQNLFNL